MILRDRLNDIVSHHTRIIEIAIGDALNHQTDNCQKIDIARNEYLGSYDKFDLHENIP